MSAHPHEGDSHGLQNPDTAHEHDDINVRAVLWFVGVLTAITIAIQIAMVGMFKGLDWYERKHEPYVTPLARPAGEAFPAPTLQTTPWTDLRTFQADQQKHLQTYGWVDEKLGVARIPIAKAKEMLLQRGLPVRPDLAGDTEGTNVAATGESSGGRLLPAGAADKSAPGGTTPAAAPGAPAGPPVPAKPGGLAAPKPPQSPKAGGGL
jgi:hypothetical protein